MVATVDEITDPVTGAAYCKERMKKCEQRAQEAEQKGDLILVAKFEGHLFAWTELLQKYLYESYKEGKTSEELTVALKGKDKQRYNAKPRGKGTSPPVEPRTVGIGTDSQGLGMAEPLRLATTSPPLWLTPDNNELLTAERKVLHPLRKDAPQGDNDTERSDSDSG